MLYLIEILHQTTTPKAQKQFPSGCILSKFYIKPQHSLGGAFGVYVVSYRNSTSNHNSHLHRFCINNVVSYRNSTSNHNISFGCFLANTLYLIEILHQTTTSCEHSARPMCCILSKFYIKPQPKLTAGVERISCILSKFYIKPQRG